MSVADPPFVTSRPAAPVADGLGLAGSLTRSRGRPQSLQARISAAILVTVVTVLFVGCTLFMLEQHRDEQVGERRYGERLSQVLAEDVGAALAAHDSAQAGKDLMLFSDFGRVASGEVRMADGRVMFAMTSRSGLRASTFYSTPVSHAGRLFGTLRIGVAARPATAALGQYLAMGGALFFAATALALFLGRWLAARITTPVARLAQAMEAVGQDGGFHMRVEAGAPDEIGRLTQQFNVLMSRLQVKDLALRRSLDALVEARDAAEAANSAKSQFLANMSHEIRTPLNGVLAMAQILARSPLEAAQREQVDVIHQSGETLLSLLNDILDVSKIEAGRLELEVACFDVKAVAAAAVAGFAAVASRKGVSLVMEVSTEAQGLRMGDAARLRQILNNFLSNALKFTERGEVRLSVCVQDVAGDEGLRITVHDTGMGIAADKLAMLFQKFTQLDASTTRRFGGTGLGLAICRELAELMGGAVSVQSEPGQGSAFSAVLPLPRAKADAVAEPVSETIKLASVESEPQAEAPKMEETVTQAAPLRVLAAEDNPTNQLVLTTIMQIFGVDLTLAADGVEAVNAWRDGRFDVVLMDIQMPRQDGVTATRRIRAEEAETGRARTPILALSANALTHQVEAYLAAGMDGHVAKPIELAKLQAALEEVLESAAAARAAA